MSKLRIGDRERGECCVSVPSTTRSPPPPTRQLSLSQSAVVFSEHWFDQCILRSFGNVVRSLYSVVVRVEASGKGGRRFHSRQEQYRTFMGGEDRWRAGTYSFCVQGGDGWRAGTRGEGQARRADTKYFWCGGGLSASSGTDTFKSVQHHYALETISLSNVLWITRRRFYLYGFE
jgi:hypothetical protein